MTDNISRLYRLSNIDKVFYVSDDIFEDGYDLNSIKEDYPPFTDTKQLELIKWIAINNNTHTILSIDKLNNQTRLSIDKNKYDVNLEEYDYSSVNNDFSQALAGLVCELWEDLTDEQREEVRGILK